MRAIRHDEAARESVRRILGWDFDRVGMSYGEVLESGGRGVTRLQSRRKPGLQVGTLDVLPRTFALAEPCSHPSLRGRSRPERAREVHLQFDDHFSARWQWCEPLPLVFLPI